MSDEDPTASLPLRFWRRQLLFRLQVHHFDLALKRAQELLQEPRKVLLCGACENGRKEDCSGWCGIASPVSGHELPVWVCHKCTDGQQDCEQWWCGMSINYDASYGEDGYVGDYPQPLEYPCNCPMCRGE